MTLNFEDSTVPVAVDLSHLKAINATLTGTQIATEITAVINRQFGDQSYFDLTDASSKTFQIQTSRLTSGSGSAASPKTITLAASTGTLPADLTKCSIPQVVAAIQAQLDLDRTITTGSNLDSATPTYTTRIVVTYDYSTQSLKFTDSTNTLKVYSGSSTKNDVLGFPNTLTALTDDGLTGLKAVPNGVLERAALEQRYGMKVTYDSVNKIFTMKSGTTGDQSSMSIAIPTSNTIASSLLGFSNATVAKSTLATRGIAWPITLQLMQPTTPSW
jgi:hypothetical protein